MSLQEAQASLASAAKDLNLRVPEGQVTALFTAATTALSGATPEKVVQLTALLQGFSNPNLSDLKSITEIQPGQTYNLPGGGTVELTKEGVDIKGPVSLAELEKFSDGTKGTFNLKDLSSYYVTQDVNGISVLNNVEAKGFNKSQAETEKLVGGADKLPAENNAALAIFAAQFLPEFQAKYQQYGWVAVRTSSGFAVCANSACGVRKVRFGPSGASVGAVVLSSSNKK